MERITKVVFLFFLLITLGLQSVHATTPAVSGNNAFNWDSVMAAIIEVESHGDSKAQSGNSVGVMQITPVLVAHCNELLKRKKSKKRFKLSDRFSIAKSKEMFLLFQSVYNPANNIEFAIRSWNGGLHFKMKRTQRYFEKVMRAMR